MFVSRLIVFFTEAFRQPLRRAASALLAAACLAACSPEYNWRELDVADGRARAAFPARVQTEQRPIVLDGKELPFSLTAARVGQAVFAVGHAPLPTDPLQRERMRQALVASLYANMGARPPEPAKPDDDIEIRADVNGQPTLLMARVRIYGDRLVEAVAAGPAQDLPPERASEFVRSLMPSR